jgi:glycosyltransferase involved in cell wall biosynthesis
MQINVLDPALLRIRGHHFDLDAKIIDKLIESGHTVSLYCNKDVQKEVLLRLNTSCDVVPLFRANPYAHPKNFDRYAGELLMYLTQSKILSEDLQKVAYADIWMWPSIFASQINACATVQPSAKISGCIHTPSNTMLDPFGKLWWRHAFLRLQQADTQHILGTIDPEVRLDYAPLASNTKINIFPHYYEGLQIKEPKKALKKIGFFGHQRGEKGIEFIPDLVNKLASRGFSITLQDSALKYDSKIHSSVERLGFVEDLSIEIAKCDLIILPYSIDQYKRKASGILFDALASGVPVIVPFDTALGRWIDQTGAGTQFYNNDVASILHALSLAGHNYGSLAKAAYITSQEWRTKYGISRFTNAMLDFN